VPFLEAPFLEAPFLEAPASSRDYSGPDSRDDKIPYRMEAIPYIYHCTDTQLEAIRYIYPRREAQDDEVIQRDPVERCEVPLRKCTRIVAVGLAG